MHEKLAVEIQKILQRKNLVFTSTFVDFFSKDEHVQQLDQLLLHLGVDFNRIIACEQLDLFAKKSTSLNYEYDLTVSCHDASQQLNKSTILETQQMSPKELNSSLTDDLKDGIRLEELTVDVEIDNNTKLEFISQNDDETKMMEHLRELETQKENMTCVQDGLKKIDTTPTLAKITPLDDSSPQDQSPTQITIEDNHSMYSNEVKFQVENARVGQFYNSKISISSAHDFNKIRFKAESFRFGKHDFYFDEESQTVRGEPEHAEEFEFTFQYSMDNATHSGRCKLNIIPDPRSLWKVLEPEAGQPFIKDHTDQRLISTEKFDLIAASRRGRSHEHAGTFRDDDFSLFYIPDTEWSVITVADGAGSAIYSREGSRIAVDIVEKQFSGYLNAATITSLEEDLSQWQIGQQDEVTKQIAKKLNEQFFNVYYDIYKSIIEEIELQAKASNVPAKAFSTTLLVAVVRQYQNRTFISTFSVGDGAIAVYRRDSVRLMNVADGGEYAGQTQFLDRSIASDFGTRIKIGHFNDIDAVLIMTDGISDPIFETEVGLGQHPLWTKMYQEIEPLFHQPDADVALLEWMHFFKPGHHDDRTMAVLWNKKASAYQLDQDSTEV
ncbi:MULTISPECIES: PP2C family serine/threonine-protein phosphatase [Acinetobacter]|uniref:PP2C family serine/threonine-protein phosphatase n=1 Tax=Acinetobacter TaxID=469 RepID=UPI00157B3828|nr:MULTISPECIES: PP2C family serine/threonine-protein phosphatase [Acinetobacter]MDU4033412.1 PP2C family serine/threonine-protein phosphatase [Acinetobacter sp.]NTY97752.1 protein phosphatase 2C domain-containing protein [Acinetobacter radioresistens]